MCTQGSKYISACVVALVSPIRSNAWSILITIARQSFIQTYYSGVILVYKSNTKEKCNINVQINIYWW